MVRSTPKASKQFTKEQYEAARKVSALEYAKAHGYSLVAVGHRYQLQSHDSMIFLLDGRWYWNSTGHYGRALEFMIYYENKTLVEAVLELAGGTPHSPVYHNDTPSHPTPLPFALPPATPKAVGILIKYLVNRRACDMDIVRALIKAQRIYISCQEKDGYTLRNAVFVGFDVNNIPRSATMRGINYGSHFKVAVPGSDKSIPFSLPCIDTATTLSIFEAPIDAISHATLDKRSGAMWQETQRIALCGNPHPHTIKNWLSHNPQINRIELCLDNDQGGRKMDAHLRQYIAAAGFTGSVLTNLPSAKDWNDVLLQERGD